MDALTETRRLAAELRNAAYVVRHYPRPVQRAQRAQAIERMGLAVRHAFNASDDFEPLLVAIVEGLGPPQEYKPPF